MQTGIFQICTDSTKITSAIKLERLTISFNNFKNIFLQAEFFKAVSKFCMK